MILPTFVAVISIKDCVGCGICVDNCEMEAIPRSFIGYISTIAQIDKGKCNGCGICIPLCPQNAMCLVRLSSNLD